MSDDLIERQAAIDEIKEIYEWHDNVTKERIIEHFVRLPSAQPEKRTEKRTETHSCDLIDREAAVDAIYHHLPSVSRTRARTMLHEVPSVQPARLKGRWIERNPQNSDKCRLIECDQCGFSHIVGFNVPYEHWIEDRNFCERCGADMRGEQDG